MKAYLDNNATTRMAPEVLDAMMPFLREKYGNPSSFHSFGGDLMEDVRRAREQVASLLGSSPEEVYFTSGGTESDNIAILGALGINPLKPELVTSLVEHPAVLRTARRLESQGGVVRYAPVKSNGELDLKAYRSMVNERTGLVSIMMANNETGVIMPLQEASAIARDAGALFHTDAVQAAGKIPLDVVSMGIDLLSISAHKFHGPKGVGALYIGKGIKLPSLMSGGHQEDGMRPGTHNVPGIVGLGKAAELAQEHLSGGVDELGELRGRLEKGILSSCRGSRVIGKDATRLSNTSSILFGGVESEAVLTLLDMEGICASSGSACSTGESDPSHVLLAMGIDPREANSAIRFSLSRYTTEEEVQLLLEVLPGIISKLSSISPYAD